MCRVDGVLPLALTVSLTVLTYRRSHDFAILSMADREEVVNVELVDRSIVMREASCPMQFAPAPGACIPASFVLLATVKLP